MGWASGIWIARGGGCAVVAAADLSAERVDQAANGVGDLLRIEGLCEIGVRAGVHTFSSAIFAVQGGNHNNGHASTGTSPKIPAALKPVYLRQHDIQQNGVGLMPACNLDRLGAAVCRDSLHAINLEQFALQMVHLFVVLDDDDKGTNAHEDYRLVYARACGRSWPATAAPGQRDTRYLIGPVPAILYN